MTSLSQMDDLSEHMCNCTASDFSPMFMGLQQAFLAFVWATQKGTYLHNVVLSFSKI